MFGNTLLGLCCASGPPHGGRLRLRWTTASVVLGIGASAIGAAHADPNIVLPNGLPVQVKPTFQEPGLPAFSFPVGGSSSAGGSSSGVYDSGGSSVSSGGSGDAYNTMMAQGWGSQAADAASYELRTDAMMLQTQENMSNPTVLAVRAVYQFGAGAGPDVAAADDSENIAQLTGLSAASLAANGLSSSSTVGQWRATIIAKLGSATANQSVFAQ